MSKTKGLNEFVAARLQRKYGPPRRSGGIEKWLEEQRTADTPDERRGAWDDYRQDRLRNVMCALLVEQEGGTLDLSRLAENTRMSPLPADLKDACYPDMFLPIFRSLRKAGVRVTITRSSAILQFPDWTCAFDWSWGPPSLMDMMGEHYLFALLATWQHHGQRWKHARAYLCDLLAADVEMTKAKARAAFANREGMTD